jgi:2'-5' RNA ligase
MLYVVAWPLLAEADDTALRHFRAQYYPQEADLVGPHFTLVFGAGAERETGLRAALASVRRRPFWFMIERIARHDLYLYAEPSDGALELTALYEALNPVSGREPFEPHMTLGLLGTALEAEQVARIIERLHLPIRGRVEELALLKRNGDRLETIATAGLGG